MKDEVSNLDNEELHGKEKLRFYETWTFLILFCICVPILIRSFFYTPFHIPSGSMKPTLLVGDYIFVSKYAYGYSKYSLPFGPNLFEGRIFQTEPKRGDIIVFRLPTQPHIDYIKRLIGLPGDKVQMVDGELYINGNKLATRKIEDFYDADDDDSEGKVIKRLIETLPEGKEHEILDETPSGSLDTTKVFTVPDGHYFFMGDNRDNSQDSRVQKIVGFVPAENLVGRADLVLISTKGKLWKIWEWFTTLRTERSFTKLN